MEQIERTSTIKAIAMPENANPDGDVFGGWIVSMMDLSGGVIARRVAQGRVVTVAMEHVVFHKPVLIGDLVECFTRITRIGTTSVSVEIDVWVERRLTGEKEQVTQGQFTYVAIGEDRRPLPIRR